MRCENGSCLIDSEGGEIAPGSPEDEMEGRVYAETLILCLKASLAEAEKPADTQPLQGRHGNQPSQKKQ
ncbi:hypothetical protein E1301_Tti011965 [Triplophysa tibetana]|uniref:Uncharacterized protein n=1 Tax=Triplophysa tibetana TaxID=1572043 RepID=A0A5A9PKD7_9TELE|nr:hypothetical protein E1301_Tti011965 [Triplophysa tibetana]